MVHCSLRKDFVAVGAAVLSLFVGLWLGLSGTQLEVWQADDLLQLKEVVRTIADGPPAAIFFDLDETLVMRNTSLVYGFPSTDTFLSALEDLYSAQVVKTIHQYLEQQYYNASIVLVDERIPDFITELRGLGHQVFALTSNPAENAHFTAVLAALARHGVRFTEMRKGSVGVLELSQAQSANHPLVGGVLNCRHGVHDDKGAIMAEFWRCFWGTTASWKLPGKCILVDNTLHKCQTALRHQQDTGGPVDIHAIWYRQAELSHLASLASVQLAWEQLALLLGIEDAHRVWEHQSYTAKGQAGA